MNVRLAVETLSNSVANSMQFLMDRNYEEFSNAAATIKFVRVMNDIFDVMNSKRLLDTNSLKSALNPLNQKAIFDFFENARKYLQSLKLPDKNEVISSNKRTAFRGFIINMINIKSMYEECVETGLMNCLPTFKFSQDHVESFFGRIRSKGGYNDNPTVEQFCSAFRRIVINNEITSSELSNCKDSLNILYVSSRRPKLAPVQSSAHEQLPEYDEFLANIQHVAGKEEIDSCNYLLDNLEDTSIAHTAGWIENKIETSGCFLCTECVNVFHDNDQVNDGIKTAKSQSPCRTTYKICGIAHRHVKVFETNKKFNYNKLLSNVMMEIDFKTAYSKTNFEGHESHKYYFIKTIVEEYIRAQANYIAKRVTLVEQKKMLRSKLKKLVHFHNQ